MRVGLGLLVTALLTLYCFNNCSQGFAPATGFSSSSNGGNASALPIVGNELNVLPITVGCGYPNEPCVTVTVCAPGTSNCVTIPNVLLDTGSSGLRVFSTLLSGLNLQQETDSSGNHITECVSYADNTSDWGPVTVADIRLGGESASGVPIQLINSTFAAAPTDCPGLDVDPSTSQYNGILGVGIFVEDCGATCDDATQPNNRTYFNCAAGGTNCNNTSIAVANNFQVSNPVAFLPTDNTGVALQFAAIPSSGATTATGWLVMGIGTAADNTPPTGAVTLPADTYGSFQTLFNSVSYNTSIFDSGSLGLYFPNPPSLPQCSATGTAPDFYCPTSLSTLSALQTGASGSPARSASFQITNAEQAFGQANYAFNDIGGTGTGMFLWGLPYFFGRTIYVGFDGKSSSLGTGPFWAY
jgi:hypothetical protein